MKGQSQRQLRVGEQIRHVISDTLRRGHFSNETLFHEAQNVTVTEVRISPDLKNATAFVMALGGRHMDEILPALNEAAGYFQKEIAHDMKARNTPRIRFVEDTSFAEAQKIENILKQISSKE